MEERKNGMEDILHDLGSCVRNGMTMASLSRSRDAFAFFRETCKGLVPRKVDRNSPCYWKKLLKKLWADWEKVDIYIIIIVIIIIFL